jgi:hypothetical protein
MATHWPPITIDLTDEGARIYTAGVLTTTLEPGPDIHADAMAAARKIAASYKRVLPLTATSPDGEFHMLLDPDGTVHTQDSPTPDERLTPPPAATPDEPEGAADLARVPHTLPRPAHQPEVVSAPTTHADDAIQVFPNQISHTEVPAADEPADTGDSPDSSIPRPAAPPRHRPGLVIPAVLAALVAATGLALHSLHATTDPLPASRAPSPISTFLDIPPRPTPSPHTTPVEASPAAPTPPPHEETPTQEAPPPDEAPQPAEPQAIEHESAPQAAPPPAVDPPQTAPDVSEGLSSMTTSVSTAGSGSATVTVHVQGSGSAPVSVTVGGVSTTITATAPGSASATLTGVPIGVQSWTTSSDGLVNSGTVTVY